MRQKTPFVALRAMPGREDWNEPVQRHFMRGALSPTRPRGRCGWAPAHRVCGTASRILCFISSASSLRDLRASAFRFPWPAGWVFTDQTTLYAMLSEGMVGETTADAFADCWFGLCRSLLMVMAQEKVLRNESRPVAVTVSDKG